MRIRLLVLLCLFGAAATVTQAREQKLIDCLWSGTESDHFIETNSWAEEQGPRPWRLMSGFLADQPLGFFLVLSNGVVSRHYPFRVDRPKP